MIDINIPLRTAYTTALNGLSYNGVPVVLYYQNAPNAIAARYYIIISPVTSVGNGDKGFNQTATTIQLNIITWEEQYNDGLAADTIAGNVLNIIYPTPQAKLTLSAGYNTQIELVSDNTIPFKRQDQRNYINRIISFRHQILN